MESKKILVLLVNYFNEDETSHFIHQELLHQRFPNLHIAIINNGASNFNTLELVAGKFPNVTLYLSPKNLGYAGGANFGWNKYLEDGGSAPDYTILSNTDIHFNGKTFFEKLISRPENSDAGIIGPSIFSALTKAEQNPMYRRRISKFKLQFLQLIFSFYPVYLLYESLSIVTRKIKPVLKGEKQYSGDPENVYAVHGSLIIFTKKFFEKGGHLNYGSFLYGEEIFFAEQCRRLQLPVVYDKSLEIVHNEHATTRRIKNKTSVKFMHDSTRYLLKKFFR